MKLINAIWLLCLPMVMTQKTTSKLIINGPQDLTDKLTSRPGKNNLEIDAVFANYGYVPYGQSTFGYLYFNSSDPLGCDKSSEFTQFDFEISNEGLHNAMILVDRGECTFVSKTRNIARSGGQMAIIVNDKPYQQINNVIMSDDGTGNGLKIPSVLISSKDGEILKDYLKQSSTKF